MPEAGSDIVLGMTTIFLVCFFLITELARQRGRLSGKIVAFSRENLPFQGIGGGKMLVEMEDGKKVWAEASGCVLCQGNFKLGDSVKLVPASDGYRILIPFFFKRGTVSSAKRECSS